MKNFKQILCIAVALCVQSMSAFSGYQEDIQVHIRRNRGVAPKQPTGTQLAKQLVKRLADVRSHEEKRAVSAVLMQQENVRVINSADLDEVSFVAFHAHGEIALPGFEAQEEVSADEADAAQEPDANEAESTEQEQRLDENEAGQAAELEAGEELAQEEVVADPEVPIIIAVVDGETVWATSGQSGIFVEHIALNSTDDGNLIATLCVHGTNDHIYYTFGDKTAVMPESDLDAVILLVKVDARTGETLAMEAHPASLPKLDRLTM